MWDYINCRPLFLGAFSVVNFVLGMYMGLVVQIIGGGLLFCMVYVEKLGNKFSLVVNMFKHVCL